MEPMRCCILLTRSSCINTMKLSRVGDVKIGGPALHTAFFTERLTDLIQLHQNQHGKLAGELLHWRV
jgi:hypothetical protein